MHGMHAVIGPIHHQHCRQYGTIVPNQESRVLLKIEIPQNIQLTFNISLKGREYDLFLLRGMMK